MNKDIRLSISFYRHIKRRKLEARLGPCGVFSFIDLLLYVGENKPDGILSGMDAEDIALAAHAEERSERAKKTAQVRWGTSGGDGQRVMARRKSEPPPAGSKTTYGRGVLQYAPTGRLKKFRKGVQGDNPLKRVSPSY